MKKTTALLLAAALLLSLAACGPGTESLPAGTLPPEADLTSEPGEAGDPGLALLEELSGYSAEDWDKAKNSGEFSAFYNRVLDASLGADQAQRDGYVMTAALRSEGEYTTLLFNILLAQRNTDAEAWDKALSAFPREEAGWIRFMTDFAEEAGAGAVVCAPFYFADVGMEEISSLSLRGLTADDLVEGDSLTDREKETVLAFIRHLSPVKVPVSREEWNDVFFCGYLCMEFTLGGRTYTVRSDDRSALYVFWDAPEEENVYIGKFELEEEYYRGAAELLYPPETPREPFVFTRENFPRLNGSTSTVPLAEAVCSVLLGESREEVSDLIQFSKTTQAYYELLNRRADLLIIGEANGDVLKEKEKLGFEWLKTPFATDAFVFVVNENNPVDSITVEEARKIYTGEIVNWAELGGRDEPIIPFQRNPEAGSQTLMEKHVMQGTPMMDAPTDYIIASMGGLMEAVKSYDNSAGAIGYSVYYYAEEMKAAQGLKLLKLEGVEPNPDTIRSGEYPILNPKYVVISAKAAEDSPARRLYDWLLSEEGQRLIADEGYVSILELSPGVREPDLKGQPWSGEWDGLTTLAEPETVTAYAGTRLRDTWPSTTGCLYGLMTLDGRAVTPPVYSGIRRPFWLDEVSGAYGSPDVLVLRQGRAAEGLQYDPENVYTLAARDLSWIWPGAWRQVIPGPDYVLLLGEDHMEQVSEAGELLGSWGYAEYGLEPYTGMLMLDFFDLFMVGRVTADGKLVVWSSYPELRLFRLTDGAMEDVIWEELSASWTDELRWSAEETPEGCRLTRGDDSLELPVPALEGDAFLWGDLVIYETDARIFRRDGSEVLGPDAFSGRRSIGSTDNYVWWVGEHELLCLNLYGEETILTYFIRPDGGVMDVHAETSLRHEDPLSVTADGNILGIVERSQAAYYRIDTGECIFRIPLPYEAD